MWAGFVSQMHSRRAGRCGKRAPGGPGARTIEDIGFPGEAFMWIWFGLAAAA